MRRGKSSSNQADDFTDGLEAVVIEILVQPIDDFYRDGGIDKIRRSDLDGGRTGQQEFDGIRG